MTTARLFVAAWPSAEIVEALRALPREERPGVRWTTPEQWHVTLRFLGNADVDAAAEALGRVRSGPVVARIGGRVGRLGRSALVIPVAGLEELAAEVARATAGVGRPPEDRRFHGHLTLARLSGAGACRLATDLEGSWTVDAVSLVASHPQRGGSRYDVVHEIPLTLR